ncbi:glutathione-disulfide reductase [Novosphingobium sp.]|jgi:glutathione reductase (NADPH)|uniref:glutathione-disulfide reductase n=1 Tax=Novosphingobium sp. TaxID=1874826 RepID=UPI0022C44874|nr:glutathione-disulfide reductase [Novosphingobium sp.]MCZ8017688.1 glutathione-disulfide reductase [Novosphingobium sp.]MCZ8033788.1 glutathione-disulfide reductase [Novosphingobium sp.]MCZ8051144.1 glutathione-disulfide reductase [Novosphingobium sp.]MCZ8059490.1 glutathione-disulfide reductase [Novosphingobium sp.]MCZ8231328.1 glutathione-disulfide reductase [Novosphingobium sp.]
MTDFDYDLFVIGAGSGGVRASRIAASHGARVAVAEEFRVGGTCVIRGCVPKKLLVYASHFAHSLHDAPTYGWTLQGQSFDWNRLRDFVASDVDRLERAYTSTLDSNKVEHFHERATVAGPNTVRLASGREITARHILIAVGAWPVMPEFEGVEHCITSNEVFHLPELPRRVAIQGAGYIALEFAGVFNALGSQVTVVNRSDKILRGYDHDLTDRLLPILQARGIEFGFNRPIRKVEKTADGSLLVHAGEGEPIAADVVLVATGRRPKTDGLGLENAGIALGANGEIPVNEYNATTCPSIHAVGDVTDRVQLTPVAIREGHAFADTVFGKAPRTVAYDHIPSAVFTQPPIAAVGLTEHEARAQYPEVKVFKSDFRPMQNMFSATAERGYYKLVVDGASDRVLGIHMLGPDAPEILQAAAIAVKAGLTKAQFDETVALHPSMAEELVLMR